MNTRFIICGVPMQFLWISFEMKNFHIAIFCCVMKPRNWENTIPSKITQTAKIGIHQESTFTILRDDFFSSPCQRQRELLPSLGVRRLSSVNFHILIFSSETPQPKEVKLGKETCMEGPL